MYEPRIRGSKISNPMDLKFMNKNGPEILDKNTLIPILEFTDFKTFFVTLY